MGEVGTEEEGKRGGGEEMSRYSVTLGCLECLECLECLTCLGC
jgi:hypothetical protein